MKLEEIVKEVKGLAILLKEKRHLLGEATELLGITQKSSIQQIEKLEKEREEIANKIAVIRMEMAKADPNTARLVEDFEASCEKIQRNIKEICHNIPVEHLIDKGLKISDDDDNPSVTVTVSKVQVASSYDVDGLLEEFPQLSEADVEGDFVILRTVDESVLERIVERDGLDPDKVHSHREVIKKRNPSVRIS